MTDGCDKPEEEEEEEEPAAQVLAQLWLYYKLQSSTQLEGNCKVHTKYIFGLAPQHLSRH